MGSPILSHVVPRCQNGCLSILWGKTSRWRTPRGKGMFVLLPQPPK